MVGNIIMERALSAAALWNDFVKLRLQLYKQNLKDVRNEANLKNAISSSAST